MSNCPLCNLDAASRSTGPDANDGKPPTGLFRRAGRGIQWLFPTTLLVLMPKCPLCVAAYVAFFSGVGVSVSTAQWIRIVMLALCLSSLAYLAARQLRRRARSFHGEGA